MVCRGQLAGPAPVAAVPAGAGRAGLVLAPACRQRQRRGAAAGSHRRARSCAGCLRRDAAQRVLRQPLPRLVAAGACATRPRRRGAPEPGRRRSSPVAGDGLAAPRRELCHRRAAGAGPGRARRRVAAGHRARAAGPPTAARACRDRAAGRGADPGAKRIRIAGLLRPLAGRSPAGHVRRRPGACRHRAGAAAGAAAGRLACRGCRGCHAAAIAVCHGALADGAGSERRRARASLPRPAAPRRARRRRAAVLLPRRAHACRAARQRAAHDAPARPPAAQRRAPGARRGRVDIHGLDGRRLPLHAHAGPRQHQPLPVHRAQLARPVPCARPARVCRLRRGLAAAGPALGLCDRARGLPLAVPPRRWADRADEPRPRCAARHEPEPARAARRPAARAGHPPRGAGRRRWHRRRAAAAARRGRWPLRRRAGGKRAGNALPAGRLRHRARARQRLRGPRRRRSALRRRRGARPALRLRAQRAGDEFRLAPAGP